MIINHKHNYITAILIGQLGNDGGSVRSPCRFGVKENLRCKRTKKRDSRKGKNNQNRFKNQNYFSETRNFNYNKQKMAKSVHLFPGVT